MLSTNAHYKILCKALYNILYRELEGAKASQKDGKASSAFYQPRKNCRTSLRVSSGPAAVAVPAPFPSLFHAHVNYPHNTDSEPTVVSQKNSSDTSADTSLWDRHMTHSQKTQEAPCLDSTAWTNCVPLSVSVSVAASTSRVDDTPLMTNESMNTTKWSASTSPKPLSSSELDEVLTHPQLPDLLKQALSRVFDLDPTAFAVPSPAPPSASAADSTNVSVDVKDSSVRALEKEEGPVVSEEKEAEVTLEEEEEVEEDFEPRRRSSRRGAGRRGGLVSSPERDIWGDDIDEEDDEPLAFEPLGAGGRILTRKSSRTRSSQGVQGEGDLSQVSGSNTESLGLPTPAAVPRGVPSLQHQVVEGSPELLLQLTTMFTQVLTQRNASEQASVSMALADEKATARAKVVAQHAQAAQKHAEAAKAKAREKAAKKLAIKQVKKAEKRAEKLEKRSQRKAQKELEREERREAERVAREAEQALKAASASKSRAARLKRRRRLQDDDDDEEEDSDNDKGKKDAQDATEHDEEKGVSEESEEEVVPVPRRSGRSLVSRGLTRGGRRSTRATRATRGRPQKKYVDSSSSEASSSSSSSDTSGSESSSSSSSSSDEDSDPEPFPALVLPPELSSMDDKDVKGGIEKEGPLADSMWTVKYRPQHSKHVIDNTPAVEAFEHFLSQWKARDEASLTSSSSSALASLPSPEVTKSRSRGRPKSSRWVYSDESDFEDDDDDYYERDGSGNGNAIETVSAMALIGKHGVGKSASIVACAKTAGWRVLEINSAMLRYIITLITHPFMFISYTHIYLNTVFHIFISRTP